MRAEPDRFEVVALGAARSVDRLVEQAHEFHPTVVAVADEARAGELAERVPSGTEVRAGAEALASLATEPGVQTVLNAVVG